MTSQPLNLPPALGLLMMLVIFAIHFIAPIAVLLPYPLNYIGLLPIILGALVHVLAERELRIKGVLNSNGELNANCSTLVTSGVYQFSRNPSHLGVILIAGGLALWVGSLSPWFIVIFYPFVLKLVFIRSEESELRDRFGLRYERYCQIVPRWAGKPRCSYKH